MAYYPQNPLFSPGTINTFPAVTDAGIEYSVICADGTVRIVIVVTADCRSWTLIFIPGEGGFPLAPES